jgi:GH15 family glucan-1,4-alpha-glucosidase
MAYQPIESYGLIGDMRTAALVGLNGSIDWLCFPHFDSPSVFASILDDEKGGRFSIVPRMQTFQTKQLYWPDTNVLVTRFSADSGVVEVVDYMPAGHAALEHGRRCVIRHVRGIRGTVPLEMRCAPAFDYGRSDHRIEEAEGGLWFRSPSLELALGSDVPLTVMDGVAHADFNVSENESVSFVVGMPDPKTPDLRCVPDVQEKLLASTTHYWQSWLSGCTYRGRWREAVNRSALALKLLTFEPTGAILAAPTCSLPEKVGGSRNWDYRYTWIRDSAFTVYAFLRIGFTEEAAAFMRFLELQHDMRNADGSLPIMFRIDGQSKLVETTLDHLDGYKGSRPVRIGNNAFGQLQLDIYGELMDAVYLYNKHGSPISFELWSTVRRLVDWVCDNWRREDMSIWETRGGQQQWVYSKLMCWVAVDRALRLADKRSFPADRDRWRTARDEIYEQIMDRGWSEEHQAFVQAYDSDTLDASVLVMPLMLFMAPTDPRMTDTIDAINRPPEDGGLVANSLVYRYNILTSPDGLPGEEGTFNLCTFWLVEALTRAGAFDVERLDEARLVFESMLGYANHLGLFAEETSMSGEAMGNFPQAFTHLALISAAFNLDRALDAAR